MGWVGAFRGVDRNAGEDWLAGGGSVDQRDLGNPPADDRHAEHDARPTAWRPHGTHRSVDERQPRDNVTGLLEAAAPSAGRRSAP
jgi:hypothetical protein